MYYIRSIEERVGWAHQTGRARDLEMSQSTKLSTVPCASYNPAIFSILGERFPGD